MAAFANPKPNVAALSGEIDLNEADAIRTALGALIDAKPRRLIVDLAGVTYIDSSGISVLIEAFQKLRAAGATLALSGLQPTVRHIFEIARLTKVFEIHPDLAAAEAATPAP